MSYLVLARKYRPRTFEEVAGQEGPMRMLQGAIREGRVGHAYLFSGPRGTGKTTSARIFAKALVCERGPTAEPCGECDHCRDIDRGSHPDVIEIDAASNRKLAETLELRATVGYAPMRARFKVYIVDEVHMLTPESFNALLKTLEEPPPHVKFLFATTEPQKVLETIRSRCQLVRLSLIREEVIAARLSEILAREAVEPEAGVVEELARLARGSLRDALSLADQVLALSGKRPSLEDVRRAAGQSGAERIDLLLSRAESGDRAAVLEALASEGDEHELVSGLLDHLRGALLAALCPADSALYESDTAELERRAARARRLGAERLQTWIEELLHARERIAHLPEHARIVLELALLELCRPELGLPLAVLEERLLALERRLELASAPGSERVVPPAARAGTTANAGAGVSPRTPLASERAARGLLPPSDLPARAPGGAIPSRTPGGRDAPSEGAGASWQQFLEALGATHPALRELLERRAEPPEALAIASGSAPLKVRVAAATQEESALLGDPASRAACEAVLARLLGKAARVVLAETAPKAKGERDAFTRSVADLFTGHIEEDAR